MDIETCSRIIAAGDYSSLVDETTETANRDGMSIFIRYVNSDTRKVNEEHLDLIEILGSKGAEALCKKIVRYWFQRITQLPNFASLV